MPKQPGGITKSIRMDCVRRVVEKFGRIRKTQIDARVSALLGISSDEVSRAIYRDLDELVGAGKLSVEYFTRDGEAIVDFDRDLHKNTVAEWMMPGCESRIVGRSLIDQSGSQIFVPKFLESFVEISDEWLPVESGRLLVMLTLKQHSISIAIDEAVAPVVLLFGRRVENEFVPKNAIEARFGKRVITLALPVPTMSSVGPLGKLGHFSICLDGELGMGLLDHSSKNGTFFSEVSLEQLAEFQSYHISLGEKTAATAWSRSGRELIQKDRIAGDCEIKKRPFVVFASSGFPILFL